jgi:hypothetical protein
MDETTNPEPGVEGNAAPDDEQLNDAPEGLADEQPDDAEQPDADVEDVEYEGKKYAVPKEIKDALLRQADYTRKTQEVAESRKQLEAQAAEVKQFAQFQQGLIEDVADYRAAQKAEKQYEQIDWARWAEQDPAATQVEWIKYQQIKGQREVLERQVQSKASQLQQQRGMETQQAIAKRFQEAEQALASDDKTWDVAKSSALAAYITKEYGFDKDELTQAMSPKFARMMRDAMTGRKAITTATAKPPPAPVGKPVTPLRSNTPASTGLHDGLSTEEWVRRRNSQLQAKRK